jgi:Fur family ferric uptake transcriptional regulator
VVDEKDAQPESATQSADLDREQAEPSADREEIEQAEDERIEEVMEAFHKRLQEAGKKSTRQRDVIVDRFFRLDKHITADELLEDVREELPRIGYATVYRTLKLLVEQNFALPKDFGDGQTRYDPIHNQDPQHDHLICVDCRKIIEFTDNVLDDRLSELVSDMDYSIRRKELELYVECQLEDCPNLPKDDKE